MKIDAIIGIDPGAGGGLVLWRANKKVTAIKMPKDLNDIRDYLNHVKDISCPIVFLEELGVRPGDVSIGDTGVNMGKLYRIQKMLQNYEQLKAIITVLDIPFITVHPAKWQSALKLRIKKEEKKDRKNRYKDIASKLYPDVKATLWNADATLIMHFGRLVLKNNINWVIEKLPIKMREKYFDIKYNLW